MTAAALLEKKKEGFKDAAGQDTRNYGIASGIEEIRAIFGEIMGTDKDNIFMGNSSSLNQMFDAIMRAMVFGEVDSPKPWAQVDGRKWLCPAPGYDRHFKITEYFNEYHRGEVMEEYDSVEIDYGGFFLFEKEIKNTPIDTTDVSDLLNKIIFEHFPNRRIFT